MTDTLLNELFDINRDLNRIFEGSGNVRRNRWPETNIYESKDAFVLVSKVPGMDKGDIDISIKDNSLTIRGERKKEHPEKVKRQLSERFDGAFERNFILNQKVDVNAIVAEAKNGLLIIRLPKAEEAKAKKIDIA